jgi:hypothetical protein
LNRLTRSSAPFLMTNFGPLQCHVFNVFNPTHSHTEPTVTFSATFGRLTVASPFQIFEQTKQRRSFSNAAELDTESLHFNEQFLHIDDFVLDQRSQEYAH